MKIFTDIKIIKNILLSLLLIMAACQTTNALKIDVSRLDKKCRELEKMYGSFGLVITDPQNGKTSFIYNKKMICEDKYCPGSLLKPFVIISCSKKMHLDMNEQYMCGGYKDETDKICWLKQGHGKMNLVTGLSNSCNFYFYKFIRDKLDRETYFGTLKDYGVIDGNMPFQMNDEDFFLTSIGLGTSIKSSPEDIIHAYNALFNRGILFDGSGSFVSDIEYPGYIADILRSGMMQCHLYGTAKSVYERTGLTDVIAKTGTGIYLNETDRIIGWIVALYPSADPAFSMLVIIKNRKSSISCEITAEVLTLLTVRK